MNQKYKEFVEAISTIEELREELREFLAENGITKDTVPDTEAKEKALNLAVEFAKNKGYEITKEDIVREACQISEEGIENVYGGRLRINEDGEICGGDCGCAFGGGGTGDEYQKTCVCVVGGGGSLTDKGLELERKQKENGGPDIIALCCPLIGVFMLGY